MPAAATGPARLERPGLAVVTAKKPITVTGPADCPPAVISAKLVGTVCGIPFYIGPFRNVDPCVRGKFSINGRSRCSNLVGLFCRSRSAKTAGEFRPSDPANDFGDLFDHPGFSGSLRRRHRYQPQDFHEAGRYFRFRCCPERCSYLTDPMRGPAFMATPS